MDVASTHLSRNRVADQIGVECQRRFRDFLDQFYDNNELKYVELAKKLKDPDRSTLDVNYEDVEKYSQVLATILSQQFYRLNTFLNQTVSAFVKKVNSLKEDKECYVSIINYSSRYKIRDLKTIKVGCLVRITGQVTRTHPVHPELVYGAFMCADCQTMVPIVEQQFKYTLPTICRNPACNNRKRFILDTDKSVFVDFQKIRVQETQAELPRGCVPRSLEVIVREENVEMVQAGGRYDFVGTLIVVPDVGSMALPGSRAETSSRHKMGANQSDGVRGLKALGVRDLHYKMAFLACSIQDSELQNVNVPESSSSIEVLRSRYSESEWDTITRMSNDRNLYQNLINSLFANIHGNDEVKRGILLMLFGGVQKTTKEGTTLRGDINCCIVGDPSTAKSQFLKQVANFAPRAVYTSGKASTAAGLTAAVIKDEETGNFVIEAGALMLADGGICCIDEFDKMDLKDQVAIHEAMEQQTISIAKAGVRASLNARTSILAAANPIGSTYDRSKSLQQNIALSSPIMSRFDLFFVLVDECNEVVDLAVAKKILDMHRKVDNPLDITYSKSDILLYIKFSKNFKPILSEAASNLLVHHYTKLRARDSQSGRWTWRITVRQLESMVRLAEAMARMQLCDKVLEIHVEEAYRLLNKSIIRVEQPDIYLENNAEMEDMMLDAADEIEAQADNQTAPRKKLMLTFDEYKTISNMIITYLRQREAEIEDQGGEKDGLRKSDVISWYIQLVLEQMSSEDELLEKREIAGKVIDRLIHHDHILISLTTKSLGEGKKKDDAGDDEDDDESDPFLIVHPNYTD